MKISYEYEILQSPELVFPWIAEPEKAVKWQKNVKSTEIIKNTPEMIGTTFKEVIEEGKSVLEMNGTIIKYIPNRLIGFHLVSKIHEFDVDYSIEGKGKTTKLSIEAMIKWKFPVNIFSLFIHKKMEENIKKQLEAEVQDLKKLCVNT